MIFMLWRFNATPQEWVNTYRFRYYADNKAFDSDDRKAWYAVKFEGTEAAAEKQMTKFLNRLVRMTRAFCNQNLPPYQTLMLRGDMDQVARIVLQKRPSWMHMNFPDGKG